MTQAFNLSQLANNLNTSGQLDATDGLVNAVPIANGGTGATTAAGARTNLDVLQGVTPSTSGNVLTSTGSAWVSSVPAVTLAGAENLTNKTLTNPTITNYVETLLAIGTVGSTVTLALTSGTVQTATLTSLTPCTFTMPTATAGKSFILILKQPTSGTATTATFTGVKWNSNGAPVITAALSRADILSFVADGAVWYGAASQGYTP